VIASLDGVLAEKHLTDAVVDVHGVGYRVTLSLLTLASLPEAGAPVRLRVRTVVREDAFDLYGFLTLAEEDLFLLLTSVSKVGPKVAMSVLSGLEPAELTQAIAKGDVARLTRIRGVGRKTAERLVLELKEKMKLVSLSGAAKAAATATATAASSDLISALLNLGYKQAQAENAARVAAERAGEEAPFEALFREALKALRGG
jgi:holliday junction DNA helicase RuvA